MPSYETQDLGGGGGPATELLETGGPTELAFGAIADGQVLRRNGTTVVGRTITVPAATRLVLGGASDFGSSVNLTFDGTDTLSVPKINSGASSGGNLDLTSTSHATKGLIRLGGASGLIVSEPTGIVGIGATEAGVLLRVRGASGQTRFKVDSGGSGGSVLAQFGSNDAESALIQGCANDATSTLMGINRANATFFYGSSNHVSVVVGGLNASSELVFTPGNAERLRLSSSTLTFADAINMAFNTSTGTKIGTATGQKLGFWNATPVVQQVLATGAGATVDNVISLLQTLGLCKQS